MGTVMMAAFLEWFLWLAAFIYCLVKVFQKAEHWTIRLLAVAMIILFTLLRYALRQEALRAPTNPRADASSFPSWS